MDELQYPIYDQMNQQQYWYGYPDLSLMQHHQIQLQNQQMQGEFTSMSYMPSMANISSMANIFQYTTMMPPFLPATAQPLCQIQSLPTYEEWRQKNSLEQRAHAATLQLASYSSRSEEKSAWNEQDNWVSEQGSETSTHKRPFQEESPTESKKMKLTTEVSPLSKFHKEHCCGHGTFGKVWAAKEKSTGRTVALKQIKLNGNEGFPRTAIREIIIMKKHVHPNILSIEEVVWAQEDAKDDFEVYLVMDYYNYDLRRLLEKFQLKFNSSEVKYLFGQLAEGVAYLHKNILMHRDLKTENILINTTGHLKICDFGLSRAFNPEGRMKTYTPVVITLWYRPPELLLGPCAYSCEVDQWSVGCIFAEIVRSAVLFAGNGEIDQADKIFSIMGSPSEVTWPEYMDLSGAQKTSFRNYPDRLRTIMSPEILSEAGYDLLTKLLAYRPEDRITAAETLDHPYFSEYPLPVTMIDIDSKVIIANKST